MTITDAGAAGDASRAGMAASGAARGWYLYGITRRGALGALLAGAPDEWRHAAAVALLGDDAPVQLLEHDELAAVVSPVRLADFSQAVVQERLRSADDLEAMVRSHHRVIEAVHAHQAILPAKFGMVYTHPEDIVSSLQSAHDTLLRQLEGLEGCDEWAVHLYADAGTVRDGISSTDPEIRSLRAQCAGARPGRAYFLERQLRDELEAATEQALTTLAQRTFDALRGRAVAGQVGAAATDRDSADEVEILRASFLVRRDDTERFMDEMHATADACAGVRSECSGPWPPYSFAAREEGEPA